MPKRLGLMYAIAVIAFLVPLGAHATVGAVLVACRANNCDAVKLGEICDTFQGGSFPIGVSCENVATPGRGTPVTCGAAGSICTPYFRLTRDDFLGSYCFGSQIGGNNDAVVMCDTSSLNAPPASEGKGKK